MNELNPAERTRYSRHIMLPEFGRAGQEKLKQSKVLVVGAGGLGCPLLLYLAAAGVGTIGIVDFDVVDDSNLQRQVLFTTDDIGKSKAQTAKRRLEALNPHLHIIIHETTFSKDNALELVNRYDVVADGTDNFPTRYLVNDACVLAGKTLIYASIYRFEGQVAVFNYPDTTGERGPNYRDLFPTPPPPTLIPNCAESGVLGVLPGIIGTMQASEVIKVLTGIGEPLAGRLFLFDAASFTTRVLKVVKNPATNITELIDYEDFCGISISQQPYPLKEINVQEFQHLQNQQADFQLIDVREPYEYDIAHLQGELIPSGDILNHLDKISTVKKVILYCRSGQRSAEAIRVLEQAGGFDNLYNLKGGFLAYAKEVDTTLPTY